MTALSPPPPPLSSPLPLRRASARRRTFWALLINIGCVTAAETFLKIGAAASAHHASVFGLSALHSPFTIVGICFHVSAFAFWIYALRTVPLALAFNFTALNHVLVPLSAWTFLHEKISTFRWAGIALVAVGFVLLVPILARAEAETSAAEGSRAA